MRALIRRLAIPVIALSVAGLGSAAVAQDFKYDCQNEPVAIAIPGDRLENALKQLRMVTRCPISGTKLARGKRSKPVVGTMTPAEAMQAMLDGTGLHSSAIRGGFQVTRVHR